jgi:hypothetical protein
MSIILVLLSAPAAAEDMRIDLERRDDARVTYRLDESGFAIVVEVEGNLQKLEPASIHIATQQKGRWEGAQLDVGRYLKAEFDADKPQVARVETTLKFDLGEGERRFSQERDLVQREILRRAGSKEDSPKARNQILLERISAIRDENISAGADKRGKTGLHTPPLPRQALNFEKTDALERLLKDQCSWKSVADVFKATQFQPPDERDSSDFSASATMAEEIRQAMMGIKFSPRYLSDSQYRTLEQGSHYRLTARFIPEVAGIKTDGLWRNAPALRLADGVVKRATLEGSLDRARGIPVAWWKVESESPTRVQVQMTKGDGDCFWNWVETPNNQVRYLRLLLHSPGTRYRVSLSISGAAKGEEVMLYDGPVNAPVKAPF